jgi:hypothetical protein
MPMAWEGLVSSSRRRGKPDHIYNPSRACSTQFLARRAKQGEVRGNAMWREYILLNGVAVRLKRCGKNSHNAGLDSEPMSYSCSRTPACERPAREYRLAVAPPAIMPVAITPIPASIPISAAWIEYADRWPAGHHYHRPRAPVGLAPSIGSTMESTAASLSSVGGRESGKCRSGGKGRYN